MNAWSTNPALYLSPEMVAELALGVDPPLQVAQKYGLSPAEFMALQAQDWFGKEIYRKREELHADGMTFQVKARMIAEEVMQDFFRKSKTQDLRPEHLLEFLKQTAGYGGLTPKVGAVTGPAGPAFQINITLPDNPQGPSLAKIETADAPPEPLIIEMTAQESIPPPPPQIAVPGFRLTNDLRGEMVKP